MTFWIHFAQNVWNIIGHSTATISISILFLFIVLGGWFFAPMLCRAAITHLVAQAWRGEEMEKGFPTALFRFFPLFEVTAVKRALSPISFFTEFSFITRNLSGAAALLTPLLLFFGGVGIVLLFFLTYATQAIVLEDAAFTAAIKKSFSTVIEHFTKTLKILILFFLVELRVLINILLILAVPIIIAGTSSIFAGFFSDTIGIGIGLFVLFLLILLTAYVSGILFVFSEAIVTVAFLELHHKTSISSHS